MAKYVVTGTSVTVGTADISASVAQASLEITSADVDATDFGSGGWTEVVGGLKSGTLSLDIHQDFAAGAVESIFYPLIGSTATVVLKPNGTAVGPTNPSYSFSVLVNSWSPIVGAVGDLATVSVSYPTVGAVTKATA